MNRRRHREDLARIPGSLLSRAPADLDHGELEAWRDIVSAAPAEVLRMSDGPFVRALSSFLADWRASPSTDRAEIRELYRSLGQCLVPMRARRRMLFPRLAGFVH